jgi:hypothetical protein
MITRFRRSASVSGLLAINCLASLAIASDLVPGAVVWAEWSTNDWHRGTIQRPCDAGMHVAFHDGDKACLNAASIALDRAPQADEIRPGVRVLAPWVISHLYPGQVVSISGDRAQMAYDDGDTGGATVRDLRIIGGDIPSGAVVWAEWSKNSWYHGTIERDCDAGKHVLFDDGYAACIKTTSLALDRVPQAEEIRAGTRVLAPWPVSRLYPGEVVSVGGGRAEIAYDDGDAGSAPLGELRLVWAGSR